MAIHWGFDLACCRGASNATAPLPAVHRAAQPRTRLILMLREPAARMHSAFWYYGCLHGLYQRHGLSAGGFHAFAQARRPCRSFARMQPQGCMRANSSDIWARQQ